MLITDMENNQMLMDCYKYTTNAGFRLWLTYVDAQTLIDASVVRRKDGYAMNYAIDHGGLPTDDDVKRTLKLFLNRMLVG